MLRSNEPGNRLMDISLYLLHHFITTQPHDSRINLRYLSDIDILITRLRSRRISRYGEMKFFFLTQEKGNHTSKFIPIERIAKSWQRRRERSTDLMITETRLKCRGLKVHLRCSQLTFSSLNVAVGFSHNQLARYKDPINVNANTSSLLFTK